jgi:hypothetical protein
VIASESPEPTARPGGQMEECTDPPSLLQRAPVRLTLTVRSTSYPPMTRKWVHVQSGRLFEIQVVPPHASAKIQITAEQPLQMIVPVSSVEDGAEMSYRAKFSGHSHGFFSLLPGAGKLHVCIIDGLPNPCELTIPVAIWPRMLALIPWFLIMFGTLVWARFHEIISHSPTVGDMVHAASADLPAILACATVSGLSMGIVRVFGWVMLIPHVVDED